MNSRNLGWQAPRRKSMSPPVPAKVQERNNEQLLPVTISHARSLSRLLEVLRKKVVSVAFCRIACRGDKERPRKAGILILHELFKFKLQVHQQYFLSIVQRQLNAASKRSEIPQWFQKELQSAQPSSRLIEEAEKQKQRVGQSSEKGILLNSIAALCRTNIEDKNAVQARLLEFNNLSEAVIRGQAGARDISSWYRNNVTKMSPEMRRLKGLLVRCQQLTAETTQQTPSTYQRDISRSSQGPPSQRKRRVNSTDTGPQGKQALVKEIMEIVGMAANRRFAAMKTESSRGRFPQLRQLVDLIVELMEQYPQPGQMLSVEELATAINDTTKKLKQIDTAEIQKIELAIDRFRSKLAQSENFLIKQVQTVVNYTDKLSAKLTLNPNEKLLKGDILKQSMMLQKSEEELYKARRQLEEAKEQLDRQRIEHQEEKIYQSALYKEQIDQLKSKIEELSNQVRHENERIDNLETVAIEKEEEEQKRRSMLVTVWPKNTPEDESSEVQTAWKSEFVRKPPLMRTDSETFYTPKDANEPTAPAQEISAAAIPIPPESPLIQHPPAASRQSSGMGDSRSNQRLMQELEDSNKQVERLNGVIAKYHESIKGYQESTGQYREMMEQLKQKLLQADKLDEERQMKNLQVVEVVSSPRATTKEELETGRRIMQLETALSQERERVFSVEDRYKVQVQQLQNTISKMENDKYLQEIKCDRLENELARIADQNREVSIVLSKKNSFNHQRAINITPAQNNQLSHADSVFTFSQSGDEPQALISTNGQFLRMRTLGGFGTFGGRGSDEGMLKPTNPFSFGNLQESLISLGAKPGNTNQVFVHPCQSPPVQSDVDPLVEEQLRSVDSQPNVLHPDMLINPDAQCGSAINPRPLLRKSQSHCIEKPLLSEEIKRRQSNEDRVQLAWCMSKMREYEVTIDKLTKLINAKESEIREVMKESSVRDLAKSEMTQRKDQYNEPVVQCLKCAEKLYDAESKARQFQLQCIKAQNTIDRLSGEVAAMTRRLNLSATVQDKMVKQYKRKCLELKHLTDLTDTLCKQEAHLCRHIPNLEELRTQLRDADNYEAESKEGERVDEATHPEILNLVRAQNIQMPNEPTPDMLRICNIIVSNIVDLFNKYASKLNTKQLQRILERYLIAMDKKKFKDAVQHLMAFIEEGISRLPDRSPTTDRAMSLPRLSVSTAKEIKQRFLEVVGWENLVPAIRSYLAAPSANNLIEVKKILNLE